MTIDEHVAGVVQIYDYTNHDWADIAELSDANVISCKTKRQCCADGAFEIGGCYAATLSLVCRLPGITRYQIRGCRIILRRWYEGENYTASTAPVEGVFWVTDAKKVAEIFTISGQDAMGWADTSSYNHTASEDGLSAGIFGFGEFLSQLYSVGATLEWWMEKSVELANILAMRQMGLRSDLLVWQNYDKNANNGIGYCNQYMWTDHDVEDTTQAANFWIYTADGVYKDDNPRSFLRWLAQAAGGFITVTKNGYLTLRQFVQPSLGDAVVHMSDMELDGCEVADYRLQLYNTAVVYDDLDAAAIAGGSAPSSNGLTPYRIYVEGNPFMNGFCGYKSERSAHYLSTVYGLAMSMYHYGADRNCIARPFKVKVHTTERYELGQRIRFPDWHDLGESSGQKVYRDTSGKVYKTSSGAVYRLKGHDPLYSVITGVEWTFRGGTVLSCGGEDARVMSDCIKESKADKAIRELRSRFKVLE